MTTQATLALACATTTAACGLYLAARRQRQACEAALAARLSVPAYLRGSMDVRTLALVGLHKSLTVEENILRRGGWLCRSWAEA